MPGLQIFKSIKYIYIYIYIYIYTLDPEKFDLRIYIYVGHFEFSWVNYTRTHTSNVARNVLYIAILFQQLK